MNLLERAKAIRVEGFLHCEELEKLVDLACNKDVLEIGAFMGLSAWGMAMTASTVTSIDTFKANSAGQHQMPEFTTLQAYLDATARYRNTTYHIGDSAGLSPIMEGRLFGMIFLDAMHTYEDVKADILRWWPKLRPDGIFAMHDYRHHDFPGVAQAADELFGPAPEGTTVVTLRWINKQWTELLPGGLRCGSA